MNIFQRKYQRGGQAPQEQAPGQEELMMDFAIRYLVTLGVPQEEIMDQQGTLNPEYAQELDNMFQTAEISWEDYASAPEEYMENFVSNQKSQAQMARKGAKLQRLSKFRKYKL